VVAGVGRHSLDVAQVVVLAAEALAFVGLLLVLGPALARRIGHLLEAPRTERAPFVIAVAMLLGLSVLAGRLGLAVIVGAFLAGTTLSATREQFALERQFEPITDFLAPLFFVVTGSQIDVGTFARGEVVLFAFAISVVAVVGKVAGGMLGARGLDRSERAIVGWGMVPRGEVGIIVAGLALSEGVADRDLFGSVLLMVVVTTLVGPAVLQRKLAR
jgi:Kef-type K+ transport system membrane component KefB